MEHVVEEWTRYEDSLQWRIHDAYYQVRGASAWRDREIPYLSTTNIAQTRRMARLFAASLADRGLADGDRPLWVLEVGAGSGHFAANFLKALDQLDARLGARVRLVATDYSARSLRDMAAASHLAAAVEEGRVVPARFDIGAPEVLEDLAGARFELPPGVGFDMVVASYVCSAIPMTPLQKRGAEWFELWVRTYADAPIASIEREAMRPKALGQLVRGHQWRPLSGPLKEALGAFHGAVVEAAAAGHDQATVFYPLRYFDFLRVVGPLAEGAPLVTCDYGNVRATAYPGELFPAPETYGNSFGHSVMFALFDPFAALAGWEIERTMNELDNVHVAVLVRQHLGERARASVDAGRVFSRHDTDSLTDFAVAARVAAERDDRLVALRFFQSCIALDPDDARYHGELADVALADRRGALAKEHVQAGMKLDPDGDDWEFKLGRAEFLLGDTTAAIAAYEASIARTPDAQTWLNLGAIHRDLGAFEEALRCFGEARELDFDGARSEAALREVAELQAEPDE